MAIKTKNIFCDVYSDYCIVRELGECGEDAVDELNRLHENMVEFREDGKIDDLGHDESVDLMIESILEVLDYLDDLGRSLCDADEVATSALDEAREDGRDVGYEEAKEEIEERAFEEGREDGMEEERRVIEDNLEDWANLFRCEFQGTLSKEEIERILEYYSELVSSVL